MIYLVPTPLLLANFHITGGAQCPKSSQMGETTDGGLYEIFQQDYGPVGSPVLKLPAKTSLSVVQVMQ